MAENRNVCKYCSNLYKAMKKGEVFCIKKPLHNCRVNASDPACDIFQNMFLKAGGAIRWIQIQLLPL